MTTVSRKNPDPIDSLNNIPTYTAGVAQASAHRLLKKMTENFLREYNLSMMQWFIIGTIYEAGSTGIGITKLSKMMDTNVPYITTTINILVSRNIVEREAHSEDNRAKVVRIHPDYMATVVTIEGDLRHKMRQSIYSTITPEELRIYISVLYKLGSSLD